MRRRRSWRPSGYACSRTRPSGSVSSPTCPPTCLRPGPARPASASPPPRGGGHANRRQRTVAGGRRGDGPRRRYGPPSGPLRRLGSPARKALSDKGGDAATDDHQQATTPLCRPTMIQMSRHRCRLQRPESACARTATRGGISEVERAPRRCHARAGRAAGLPARRRPPGAFPTPQAAVIAPGRAGPLSSSGGPSRHERLMARFTAVASGRPAMPGATASRPRR